jgi:hypothetical protein
MSMAICGCDFDGPFNIKTTVIPINRVSVYIIVQTDSDGQLYIRDVGVSGDSYWERDCDESFAIYLRFMPSIEGYTPNDRYSLVNRIRYKYNLG